MTKYIAELESEGIICGFWLLFNGKLDTFGNKAGCSVLLANQNKIESSVIENMPTPPSCLDSLTFDDAKKLLTKCLWHVMGKRPDFKTTEHQPSWWTLPWKSPNCGGFTKGDIVFLLKAVYIHYEIDVENVSGRSEAIGRTSDATFEVVDAFGTPPGDTLIEAASSPEHSYGTSENGSEKVCDTTFEIRRVSDVVPSSEFELVSNVHEHECTVPNDIVEPSTVEVAAASISTSASSETPMALLVTNVYDTNGTSDDTEESNYHVLQPMAFNNQGDPVTLNEEDSPVNKFKQKLTKTTKRMKKRNSIRL